MEKQKLPESFNIVERVCAAMNALQEANMGWDWDETTDRLTYYAAKLQRIFPSATFSGIKPEDQAQEAITSFLEQRRGWTPPAALDWDSPLAVSKAFNLHMRHVITSVVKNDLRVSSKTLTESEIEVPESFKERFFDSVIDKESEQQVSDKDTKESYFQMFGEDSFAREVLRAILSMNLLDNASIAAHLQVDAAEVRNAKRRIKRKLIGMQLM